MTNRVRALTTVEELDAALAASATRPILIFKHSLTCGTSAMAHEELQDVVDGPELPVDVYLVRVQTDRVVSNAIEARLKVRHESPQVLLVHDDQVLWRASHFRITTTAIREAIESARDHQPSAT